jgi:hypothetical protein
MKLKDASFLIIIYSFLMSNNKVRSPLTEIHMKEKKENRKAKCILICCFIVEPSN